jgi:hypothetical protein
MKSTARWFAVPTEPAQLRGGERDQGDIVLIVSPGCGLSLLLKRTDQREWPAADPDPLLERVFAREQFLNDGRAEHDDLGSKVAFFGL